MLRHKTQNIIKIIGVNVVTGHGCFVNMIYALSILFLWER
jgi:hypothetical protein